MLTPGTTLPFTLLHHTGIPNPHFDLLLQLPTQEKLLTWQIPSHPNTWHLTPPLATRIPDHRPLYLTYEGPLSQNRGQVTHLTHGTATIIEMDIEIIRIRLESNEITLTAPLLSLSLIIPK